jgi:Fur family ferric uptake transcriptional regulator
LNNNLAELNSWLKNNGYKLTVQRQMILELVAAQKEKHLSAEEIFELVKIEFPQIGLATVYRTIAILEKMKLLQRINLDDGCIRYQLADPNEKHEHHHLICESCGLVVDMQEDLLESLEKKVMQKNGFKVNNHRLKLYGLCEKCANK